MRAASLLLAAATLALGPASLSPCFADGAAWASAARACCKICRKGKACGNSCIARWKTCHKGKGCACNG